MELDGVLQPAPAPLLRAQRAREDLFRLLVRREDHGDVRFDERVGVARGERAWLVGVQQADGVLGAPAAAVVEDDAVVRRRGVLQVVALLHDERVLEVGLGEGRLEAPTLHDVYTLPSAPIRG